MPVKLTVQDPSEVAAPLRGDYKRGADGKFHLMLEGVHPDSAKLAEFRENNVALLKEINEVKRTYEGIDPDVARAALTTDYTALAAKLAVFNGVDVEEYRALKARPDIASVEAALATEKAAHESTRIRHAITTEFLRHGGRESAVDFIVGSAANTFAIENGEVTSKEFSNIRPGERLSVSEWMAQQSSVADFAFKPSAGGGVPKGHSGGIARLGIRPNANELRDPTPQDLGANASAIASGKLKVVYTHEKGFTS